MRRAAAAQAGLAPAGTELSTGKAMAEIRSEEIRYNAGGVAMRGYAAWDHRVAGKRPAVLVVHEWWGHGEYVRQRADMLAALGYTGFAVDMYGDGRTAGNPQEAQKLMGDLLGDLEGCRARFDAALDRIRTHPTVDPSRTAAIGYCMGGGIVLHMARYGADLDAVASFHGSLPLGVAPKGEGAKKITGRVVAYNGEDDKFISADAISAFKTEMEQLGADWQFINFPGAVHGFTSEEATANGEKFGLPLRYNALADHSSWAHLRLVLDAAFNARR
jgi:dienelactone hydrolase